MPRRAELLCALSLATDLGSGQPLEHGLRVCAAAVALAGAAGVEDREAVYCAALLHAVGCTSDAFEAARLYGDDIAVRAGYATVDGGKPLEVLGFLARHAGGGSAPIAFVRAVAAGPRQARAGFAAHCEVGVRLGDRLGLPDAARDALGFVFERWDGKGFPAGASGEAIPETARVLHVARDAVVLAAQTTPEAACRTIAGRTAYEPRLARALDPAMLAASTWEELLAHEAAPGGTLTGEALDVALQAIADFADLKSPATLGHSHRVADLAEAAAWRLELDAPAARHAGLLHDLGRVAISNAIWDKPGPLTGAESERVRLHPYYSQRALSRCQDLRPLGALAAAHHERTDGSGYPSGAADAPPLAQVVAAAEAYAGMTEARPHRPALSDASAAAELRATALDRAAVEAVLAAAGHRDAAPVARSLPAGLSEREAEVLVLVARGHPNKVIASLLGISPKTVGHHVSHVYAKIGVSTRAAAALFAVEHRLIGQTPDDGRRARP
jgi:HD-GYP domain-containing protein (c-di-GMP phosphodiesterase class II)